MPRGVPRLVPHVELIDPAEKLSGYQPPDRPSTPAELADAGGPNVWKVARASVSWNGRRNSRNGRRLRLGRRNIKCQILGSTRDWWFVGVSAEEVETLGELDLPREVIERGHTAVQGEPCDCGRPRCWARRGRPWGAGRLRDLKRRGYASQQG
jgi:hypothetical protein